MFKLWHRRGFKTCSSSDSKEVSVTQALSPRPSTGLLSNVLDDYIVFPKVLCEGCYSCVRECTHCFNMQTCACESIDKTKIGTSVSLTEAAQCMIIMEKNKVRDGSKIGKIASSGEIRVVRGVAIESTAHLMKSKNISQTSPPPPPPPRRGNRSQKTSKMPPSAPLPRGCRQSSTYLHSTSSNLLNPAPPDRRKNVTKVPAPRLQVGYSEQYLYSKRMRRGVSTKHRSC